MIGRFAGRFNERLVLSLAHCPTAILVDDELNILPTSSHVRTIEPVATTEDGAAANAPGAEAATELAALVKSMQDTEPAGSLAAACRSLDQARAVLTFLDVASDKVLRSTVALTAARGRGKSASMGLAIAGAVALGYSNVFVTAPTPENLRTLFEFVFKGLDAMGYKEHLDYDLMESTNPDFGKAIVRVNIYKSHRQVRPWPRCTARSIQLLLGLFFGCQIEQSHGVCSRTLLLFPDPLVVAAGPAAQYVVAADNVPDKRVQKERRRVSCCD